MRLPTLPTFLLEPRRLLTTTWAAWTEHDTPRLGAALAYYTAFSMAPLLILAISLAGTVFGDEAAHHELSTQLQGLLGATGARAVEEMITNANVGGSGLVATLVGTVTLLVGASSIFGELQSALNRIWRVPPHVKTPFLTMLRARFISFAMVLTIGFLLLVSLVISAVLSGLQSSFGGFITSPFVAQGINIVLSLLVTTSLFALIYKVLPDIHVAWRDVRVGAFVTAALFVVGKQLIGLYLGNSTLASTYGAAGSFAVLLVWIYYSAQLILLGAEFTYVWAHRGEKEAGGAG